YGTFVAWRRSRKAKKGERKQGGVAWDLQTASSEASYGSHFSPRWNPEPVQAITLGCGAVPIAE
ncbi:MAG: hypothetical protein P4L90_18450, partial [Rhodopila sp.]|nr:hypothetical protein [Rhodopila sp.]